MYTVELTNAEGLVLLITHIVGLSVLIGLGVYLLIEILSRASRGLTDFLDKHLRVMRETSTPEVKPLPKKNKKAKKRSKVLKATKK